MKCIHCGAENTEGASFCKRCGTKMVEKRTIHQPNGFFQQERYEQADGNLNHEVYSEKICCPCCGSRNLFAFGDRDIGSAVVSGVAVSLIANVGTGLIAGASGLKKKTYWICQECGKKFRDVDELSTETSAYKKRVKIFKVLGFIMCFVLIMPAIILCFNVGMNVISILFIILSLPFVFCMIASDIQFKNCQKELDEIRDGMGRF